MKRVLRIIEAVLLLLVIIGQVYQQQRASARAREDDLLWRYAASLETTLHDVGLGEAVERNRPAWDE